MDFSVFLFLFLPFSLFNSLSESADWGAELVAVKSLPLVPVVGMVVGVVYVLGVVRKLRFVVECEVRR